MAQTVSATDVELQKPLNAVLEQSFLRNAKARAPYFIGTAPGVIQTQGGSATIKWRRINTSADPGGTGPAPSITALAELTTTATFMMGRDSVTAAFTDVTATVAKYGQFYILNEETDLFTGWSTQTEKLMETLGIVAGRSLNQLQRNVGEDNATARFGGAVASDGAVVTSIATGDLDNVILALDTNSALTFTPMTSGSTNIGTVPILPAYWAICHPHVAADVSKVSGFTGVEKYNSQVAIAQSEFGTYSLAGQAVRFLKSEDASIDAGAGGTTGATGLRGATDIDLYTILVYGMDAIGSVGLREQQTTSAFMAGDAVPVIEFIVHEKGSSGVSDPFDEVMTMAYKFWHTGAVLNANWARAIRVGSVDR